jgi:GTPase SAR1 family protein
MINYVLINFNQASFEAVKKWRKKVEDECGTSIPTVLVQNKIDLMHQSVVSQ